MPFFFFFALMPFVSPVPINTDAQPIALLLAIIIFFIDFFQKKICLSKFEIYFLLLASFSLLFIGLHGDFEIRHRIGLLGAFFLYYAILNNFSFYYDSLIFPFIMIPIVLIYNWLIFGEITVWMERPKPEDIDGD